MRVAQTIPATIVELRSADYTYESGTPFATRALRGVDFAVGAGEFVAVLGPPRSGKSTLLQVLNAVISPDRGQLLVDGEVLGTRPVDRARARRTAGLLMQNSELQLFARTVGDDIAFGPKNLGVPDVGAAVDDALTQVGLDPATYRGRDVAGLSGGQRRRVALAGVLACRPRVLLLDEPMASLDPPGRAGLLEIVRSVRARGIGVVAASGSCADFAGDLDRVVVLEDGAVTATGVPAAVLTDAELVARTGIGLPEPVAVLNLLRGRGLPITGTAWDADGAAELIARALGQA